MPSCSAFSTPTARAIRASFVELCTAILERGAHVALGSRVHASSRMSLVRRLGNAVFAAMLTALGSTRVRDSASGMRVVRRDCLPGLMPLPDGLHFTPAMSARAILADDLTVVEVDIPYGTRTGRSKLRPVRDAWRFGRVILTAAILHRPSRPLGIVAIFAFASALFWTARLAWQYHRFGAFELWMIYHFVVIQLSTTAGVLLMTAGYLGRKAVNITLSGATDRWRSPGLVGAFLSHPAFWLAPLGLIALGTLVIAPAAVDYVGTGHIDPAAHHWSRFFAMSFAFSLAFILTSVRLLDITLDLLADRVTFLKSGVSISSDTASKRRGAPARDAAPAHGKPRISASKRLNRSSGSSSGASAVLACITGIASRRSSKSAPVAATASSRGDGSGSRTWPASISRARSLSGRPAVSGASWAMRAACPSGRHRETSPSSRAGSTICSRSTMCAGPWRRCVACSSRTAGSSSSSRGRRRSFASCISSPNDGSRARCRPRLTPSPR